MDEKITVEFTRKQKRRIIGSIQNQLNQHYNDFMLLPETAENKDVIEGYKKWIKIKSNYDEILKILGAKEYQR